MSQAHSECKREIAILTQQKRHAWAKYYAEVRRQLDMSLLIQRQLQIIQEYRKRAEDEGNPAIPQELPTFFTSDYLEMAEQLNKQFTCPICFEHVTKENIAIPVCGHIYCKTCIATMRSRNQRCFCGKNL